MSGRELRNLGGVAVSAFRGGRGNLEAAERQCRDLCFGNLLNFKRCSESSVLVLCSLEIVQMGFIFFRFELI